jgi:hypothetical protein
VAAAPSAGQAQGIGSRVDARRLVDVVDLGLHVSAPHPLEGDLDEVGDEDDHVGTARDRPQLPIAARNQQPCREAKKGENNFLKNKL